MTRTSVEEKKDDNKDPNDVQLSPKLSPVNSTTLAPRTVGPEPFFGGTALESLLSAQGDAGDTVKATNLSPRGPRHLRGVSWDLGTPGTDKPTNNLEIDRPSPVYRGLSVPAPPLGVGKPPIRGGKSNRYAMPSNPPMVTRKSSNNDGSLGSASPPGRSRFGALQNPSNMELEAETILNEVKKNEVNAETNLMRQFDEKDPLRSRAGTGASILSEVPLDEMGHNFVIEDQNGLALPSSNASEKEGSSTRTKPEPKRPPALGHQNRQLTVEQALFGLTSALTEMKANDQLERRHHGHHGSVGAHGSNDLFDVAGALFDRAHKKNVPAKEPVQDKDEVDIPRLNSQDSKSKRHVSAGSRWGAIKNNLGDIKKSDDAGPNDVLSANGDVEEGIHEANEDFDMDYSRDSQEESSEDDHAHDPKTSRMSWIKGRRKKMNPFRHLPYASKSTSPLTRDEIALGSCLTLCRCCLFCAPKTKSKKNGMFSTSSSIHANNRCECISKLF